MTSGYLSSRSRIFSDIKEGLNCGTSAGEREGGFTGTWDRQPNLSDHDYSVLGRLPPCLHHFFSLHLPGMHHAWLLLLRWHQLVCIAPVQQS